MGNTLNSRKKKKKKKGKILSSYAENTSDVYFSSEFQLSEDYWSRMTE